MNLVLVLLFHLESARYCFTLSGSSMVVTLATCLRDCILVLIVSLALPSFRWSSRNSVIIPSVRGSIPRLVLRESRRVSSYLPRLRPHGLLTMTFKTLNICVFASSKETFFIERKFEEMHGVGAISL